MEGTMRRSWTLALPVGLLCMMVLISTGDAALLTEVSKEQEFLLQRRHSTPSDDAAVALLPKGLPSSRTQQYSLDDMKALSYQQLIQIITDRDVACNGCVERHELVQRAYEVQKLPTIEEKVVQQLTLYDKMLTTQQDFLDNKAFMLAALEQQDCVVDENSIYCHPRED